MGRLRARLAATEADQELHTHLAEAMKCLGKAAHACGKVINTHKHRGVEARRAQTAQGTIQKALSLVNSIGYLTPRYDRSDRDMLSEDEQSRLYREKRRARQEAARESRKEAQTAPQSSE